LVWGLGVNLPQISSARKLIGNSSDILTFSQIARRLSTQAVAPHFSVADYFCSKNSKSLVVSLGYTTGDVFIWKNRGSFKE
jgi:hypothetical protein